MAPSQYPPTTTTHDDDKADTDDANKHSSSFALRPMRSAAASHHHQKDGLQRLASKPDGGDDGADLFAGQTAEEREDRGSGSDTEGEARVVYKVYKRRWFGLLQLTLLNIIISWDWLTFSPVSQHAAAYYGVSEAAINWYSTGFLFAFVAAAPLTVWTLHRGPKPGIAAAAALTLVGNWVRYAGSHDARAGSYGVVMLGQLLIGLAQPFVLSAPTRYSDMWFSDRGRVAATALASLANPFGSALGQLVVPFLVAGPEDVSDAVLYVAIISSVSALPSFFIPAAPPTPPGPAAAQPKTALRASLRPLARSPEIWLLLVPFAVYVGFFNSLASLLNQVLLPYGFSSDDAGIAGALLIAAGLLAAAATSPLVDRYQAFLPAIRACVPVVALSYLAFAWMPATRARAGPYAVLGVLGAASFALVPVALEFLADLAHPASPALTATVAWAGGQLLGGVFILAADALRAGPAASPPRNLDRALLFTAVVALAAAPLPLCLGLFGRREAVRLRRVGSARARGAAGEV
ncbi:MFS general substrate transporter [Xylariomycetidae sp. FL0641]|nr:MFS general substrate transporter [Xylariomycetidae sp. FL0641]